MTQFSEIDFKQLTITEEIHKEVGGIGSDGDKRRLPARRLLVDKDVPFIIHVIAIWKSLCISFDKLTEAYTTLNELAKSKQAFGNEKQV